MTPTLYLSNSQFGPCIECNIKWIRHAIGGYNRPTFSTSGMLFRWISNSVQGGLRLNSLNHLHGSYLWVWVSPIMRVYTITLQQYSYYMTPTLKITLLLITEILAVTLVNWLNSTVQWMLLSFTFLIGTNHVLYRLLPLPTTASQHYNLRPRRHTLQLPEHHTRLLDSNFVRMLYKHCY